MHCIGALDSCQQTVKPLLPCGRLSARLEADHRNASSLAALLQQTAAGQHSRQKHPHYVWMS